METVTHEAGPVEILCKEIGFRFLHGMEQANIFLRFVGMLIEEVAHDHHVQDQISQIVGLDKSGRPMTAPSDASREAIARARALVSDWSDDRGIIINNAAQLHLYLHDANPEDAYPTDHFCDMISSCVSAVRFGLETPCHSRHAAEAAHHVWRRKYGIRLEDSQSYDWEKAWARDVLQRAILSLALEKSP